jgi:internalin A
MTLTLVGVFLTGCGVESEPPSGPLVPEDPSVGSAAAPADAEPDAMDAPPDDAVDVLHDPRDTLDDPTQQPADADFSRDRAITSIDQLIDALRQRNPGFDGEKIGIQPISADLLQLAINDPTVKDISPLRRQRIAILDLRFCDVVDLSPLEDMPISQLYLEENRRLSDLRPLRGMPLHKLYLANTAVESLAPLRGAPLMELNAIGTRIKDLSPLVESPLQLLWLSDCPITDLSPLNKLGLVSLTLENTPVDDIRPLAGSRLQRLHIGGTKVTDLTPVGQMQLNRLIFTPSRIERGLDAVRNSKTIREIGTDFDQRMPPEEFWRLFDEGEKTP